MCMEYNTYTIEAREMKISFLRLRNLINVTNAGDCNLRVNFKC